MDFPSDTLEARDGLGGYAFAAPGKTQPLGSGCLDADTVDVDRHDLGQPRAHGLAVRTDSGRLAHDRDVDMPIA